MPRILPALLAGYCTLVTGSFSVADRQVPQSGSMYPVQADDAANISTRACNNAEQQGGKSTPPGSPFDDPRDAPSAGGQETLPDPLDPRLQNLKKQNRYTPAFPRDNNVAGMGVGMLVPQIVGRDTDGALMRLSDFKNRVILLKFWGSWDPECVASFEEERKLVQGMKGRPFVMLGVNNDPKVAKARKAIVDHKLNWRSFWDDIDGKIALHYGIHNTPTVILVDHHGVIRFLAIRDNIPLEVERLVRAAEDDGLIGEMVAPEQRTFRDRSGKHKTVATVERFDQDCVILRKEDNLLIRVKMEELSRADQDYLTTVGLATSIRQRPELPGDNAPNPFELYKPFRRYTDITGKFSVEASLVEIDGDAVILEKTDGSTVRVPLEKLAEEDQAFIREHGR